MSMKDRIKQGAHWVAAISSAIAMETARAETTEPDNVQQNAPVNQVTRPTTEYLDYRVKKGVMVNGETNAERRQKWAKMKTEKGVMATYEAIKEEEFKKIEIPSKDKDGYLFETYEPGKSHRFESYYPNGVQRSKMGEHGDEAVGYYPDGSKKFERDSDGVETHYHPGGAKGHEKIKETPHGLYDAYDVLDEQGRRTEHHYAVEDSQTRLSSGSVLMKDIKKVDLYNPETSKIEATYTLEEWGIENGRVAQIGFVDEQGVMQTMNFPKCQKIGDSVYYAHSLTTDMIKEMYQEEQETGSAKRAFQEGLKRRRSDQR